MTIRERERCVPNGLLSRLSGQMFRKEIPLNLTREGWVGDGGVEKERMGVWM